MRRKEPRRIQDHKALQASVMQSLVDLDFFFSGFFSKCVERLLEEQENGMI